MMELVKGQKEVRLRFSGDEFNGLDEEVSDVVGEVFACHDNEGVVPFGEVVSAHVH